MTSWWMAGTPTIATICFAKRLADRGLHHVDCGTSGGVVGLDLPDIAGVWRRGSVIKPAIDEAVPANVLVAALFGRFTSRGEADFPNRIRFAMRAEFGGHAEKGVPT